MCLIDLLRGHQFDVSKSLPPKTVPFLVPVQIHHLSGGSQNVAGVNSVPTMMGHTVASLGGPVDLRQSMYHCIKPKMSSK